MSYIVRISLFQNGERLPVLLYKESWQPVVLPLRYIVDERRDTKQAGTLEREIRVIKWLYEWADRRETNLEEFLRAGKTFRPSEITGFCRYLRSLRSGKVIGSIGSSMGMYWHCNLFSRQGVPIQAAILRKLFCSR